MIKQNVKRKPVEEFVESVKEAVKSTDAASEIKKAVDALLKSYGIETPVKK